MADVVVNFLVKNLSQLLKEEAELLHGVIPVIQSLLDQLNLMSSFLKDFESFRQEHESVKEIVNQVRDLAYEVEDVMDDYVVCAIESRQSWKKYLRGSRRLTSKSNIGKKIKDIRTRREDICNKEKMIEIQHSVEVAAPMVQFRSRRRTPVAEEANVVAFTNETQTLVEQLISGDSKLAAITIFGMAGLGKTTLAMKIFNNSSIKEIFKHRAWVHVSQNYTPLALISGILKCLIPVKQEIETMNEGELGIVLHGQLKDKRYLIVMDDVWNPQVWDFFRQIFPDDKNGSRILFTTRISGLADSGPANPPHHLRFLSKEESWELFRKKALLGESCPPQWEKIGKHIAEKCEGLPLAIVVLGSLLSQKGGTFDEWSRVANRVSIFLSERSAECKEILSSSYYELPNYMKPCFLYLGAFPEDYQIPARQLIQLWIAEGFITDNHVESMEDIAEKYLQMLIDRSLIRVVQRRSNGRVKTCSIHSLLREFCISEAARERLLVVHGIASSAPLINPRRLAGNLKTIMHIFDNAVIVRQLRSLLCFTPCFTSKSDVSGAWARLFKSMRLLRVFSVLDLGVMPKEVENLSLLRYLGLDRDSSLEIPSSICNLFNLQILDARSNSIQSAPVGIWKLRKLRHLYFEGATDLPQPPSSSSSSHSGGDEDPGDSDSLKNLQTLSTISADSCTRQVFWKMPNLLKLGVEGNLNALCETLFILKRLHTLKLVRVANSPPLISLPPYFPPNLAKLTLCDTQLEDDPMGLLGKLPKLKILKLLSNVYTGTKIVCPADGFKELQLLKLVNAQHILDLVIEKGTMPKLGSLVIHNCHLLVWLTGLQFLTSLHFVDLQKPTALLRQRMQRFSEKSHFQLHMYPVQEDPDDR